MESMKQVPASALLRPFYPSLNGLRGVAVLLVFAIHYLPFAGLYNGVRWGWIGVDIFFVLSGFLITGILYDSLHRPDYFRSFYIRRALRIFPLFYSFWLVLLIATPILHVQWNRYLLAQAFYVGNYFIPGAALLRHENMNLVYYASVRHAGELGAIHIGHFWSLAVEEQFYLVWPAVMWLVRSKRSLLRLCLTLIVLIPLGRFCIVHFTPYLREAGGLYFATPFRADTLLMGSAFALWLRGSQFPLQKLRKVALTVVFMCPAMLALIFRTEKVHSSFLGQDYVVSLVGFSLIGFACVAALALCLDESTPLSRWLTARPLAALGRISYGFYFLHELPYAIFQNNLSFFTTHHIAFLIPLSAFALSYGLASASFQFLETPFLRLKESWAPMEDHSPESRDRASQTPVEPIAQAA